MWKELIAAFIPIFVAVDAVGVLPIYVSLTHGLKKKEKQKVLARSLVTATCIAVGFVFLGKAVFKILGITVGDFMVAGGSVLFCIAVIDILAPGKKRRIPASELGAVPLGTPLIVGPAVLTTSLILMGEHGWYVTLASLIVNILIAGAIFYTADFFTKLLGESGSKAATKITSLLLAAIAIMMVRKGVTFILGEMAFIKL